MRAIVCKGYGPPEMLELQHVDRPEPRSNEVLVAIHTTTVHVGDVRVRSFNVPTAAWVFARIMLGFTRPRRPILGMELAGVVEVVGDGVGALEAGDEVFGFAGFKFGAYAEYICLPVDGNPSRDGMVARKPASMTLEEAAPVGGGGITALLVLRKAHILPGQNVLIYGASGSVGTYAVQLAKHHFGAEVTGVCSTGNLEMVKGLGADHVVDYTKEEFSADDAEYDVVFDAVDKYPRAKAKGALAASGTYLNVDSSSNGLKIDVADLESLGKLADEGKLRTVIDRSYPLEEIVAAHTYVEKGHKRGNVTVVVQQH
jgi:NADPH:quinone reductase-like Zn-dependent oxidoreductase